MKRTRLVVTAVASGALLAASVVTTNVLAVGAEPDATALANETCSETAKRFGNNGIVYLYDTEYCGGAHDAKDDTNDSDYGDGAGQIKDFDNKAQSVLNKGYENVKFYNYPDYNEGHPEGDTFCVQRGHWVNKLYLYGDNSGTWRNSISSHEFVSPGACDRWFG